MINIYKASAGSGKTYTLAREYIKLILGHKDDDGQYRLNRRGASAHRSILAITFTNKATEEMKTRIIHELAVIAGMEKGWSKESPYASELCDTFKCSREQLRDRAAAALRELLYDFNFFSVSTIDSFFQTILRSFAREAEVAGNYDLELNDEAIIGMSVDKLLQDLNHGESTRKSQYLINWLTSYMTQLIEDGMPFNVFNRSLPIHRNLIKFIDKITDDIYRENESELLAYLSDEKKFNEFKNLVYNQIKHIKQQTSDSVREALDMIMDSPAKDCVKSYIISGLKKWTSGYSSDEPSKTMTDAMAEISSAYKKPKKGMPAPSEELNGAIAKALDMIDFSFHQTRTLRIIAANLYQLGLLASLAEYIDKYRRENSTILLSDTNALISRIIGNEDAPFLYERVGVRFKHYLIDEFQDTSASQWVNIKPLINESLAYEFDNLVIGDEKQCIYRFRNSDPSLLHNLHTDRLANGRCEVRGDSISENTNWRSSVDVIRFNNTFFSALVRNLGFEDIYSNVAQQISKKHASHRGYVRVKMYEGERKADWLPEALDNLTVQLRRQLEAGYKPGEIAILVRKRDEGNTIIKHLEETVKAHPDFPHFRIVSDSSLFLGNSPTVGLIVSRLRLLSATDFTTDPRKKTKREVAALINEFENEKSRGSDSSSALLKALSRQSHESTDNKADKDTDTGQSPEAWSSVDLISLVEEIIASNVPEEKLREDSLYINAFQDLVTEFVGRGQGDIRSFLNWWDEKGYSTPVAGAQDDSALNILTIHKSKGLEYACVHIPFAEMTESNRPEPAWFNLESISGIPDEILPPMLPLELSSAMVGTPFENRYNEVSGQKKLDTVNLLYVAFTRAVNELHIGFPTPGNRSRNMAADIRDAINCCTPDFCHELESESNIEGLSPFTHFQLADATLTLGEPTIPEKKEIADKTAMSPSDLWDMGSYNTHTQRNIWSNTKLEDKYYNIEDARDRGILLHDTMAEIRTLNDVETAINNLRHSKKAKELTTDDIAEIHSIIMQRVNDPRATRWFDGFEKVMIERPIAIGGDDSRRPDRVVWTADGFIDIIDFKSGTQKPQRYMKQINEYVSLLSGLGYANVRGFLYYLDSGQIVEV
ncbi:MAG: UvrD-helicase domain-containing protein [Bacteroides sp.]|nr:UvrD-helicase domain-containing protein [Bacteroides sp.]